MRKLITTLMLAAASLQWFAPSATAQEQFSRGLEKTEFLPKGVWITGLNVNYTQSHQNNYKFLILESISGDIYSFKVSPMLMYAFKSNLAAGGRMSYERQQYKINSADLKLDSETSYKADNLHLITSNFYGTAALRNYFSLGAGMRFGMFNETQIQIGGGNSKIVNGSGTDITGNFERNFSVNIGLTPGMVMFLSNYSAIEVNVGVLGFGYTRTKAITDQIYVDHREIKKANFKINLFSVSFGVAFYL